MWSPSSGPCGMDHAHGSLSHVKMVLQKKNKIFDETNKKWKGICCVTFPITTCRSRLATPAVSKYQNWKRVCVFQCQKTVIDSYDRNRPFSFLFFQQFNSMLSTNTSTFDTSNTSIPVDNMSWIFMFLLLSPSWVLWIHSDSGEFLLPKVLHLLRFPFRHLHEIHQMVRCHHQLVPHLDSVLSLDLPAHCSAIYIVCFCRFHFSIQIDIENVVFEIDWN